MSKLTLFFTKEYPQSFLSYRDYLRHIIYALRRAGAEFSFSEGFHPRPQIYSVASLSLGVESRIEPVSVELRAPFDDEVLPLVLPVGIHYLGKIDGYIESYLALYRYKNTYFLLSHPKEGLGKFIKEKNIPPYEIIKEDIITASGSMLYYLGVK
ncbi:DUF2344 domain-containing protein [bacterium 3DAC]|nr:DUF2344 domain-containing protein [bacterium 3DAC]